MKGSSLRSAYRLLDVKMSELLWAALITLLLFQPALQDAVPALSWLDETVVLLLAVMSMAGAFGGKRTLPQFAKGSLMCLGLFVLICLAGNALSGFPGAFVPIAIDAFTCVKFFIAAVSGMVVFSDAERMLDVMTFLVKVLLVVIAVCATLSFVTDIGMTHQLVRYGLRPFEFVFPHPTYLVAALVGMVVLLSADSRNNIWWIVLASAVMVLTLRGKAMGFAALALLIVYLTRNGKKTLGVLQVVLLGVVALVIGWGQIEAYFGSEGQARFELLRTSLQISSDNFPLGAGFASFGSAVTADPEWYSPLYFQYGVSSVWGLSLENLAFISDSFWPTVLGQSGCLGLVAYCGSLAMLIRAMGMRANLKLPILLLFAYLFISSTSESAFFNPSSIYLVLCAVVAATAKVRPFAADDAGQIGNALDIVEVMK